MEKGGREVASPPDPEKIIMGIIFQSQSHWLQITINFWRCPLQPNFASYNGPGPF